MQCHHRSPAGAQLRARISRNLHRFQKHCGISPVLLLYEGQSPPLQFTNKSSIQRSENAMKLTYYPETDTLYIDPLEDPGVDADEVSSGTVLDTDADGSVHRTR